MVFGFFKDFGKLPAAYNERVHGPYDPAVFYGKKDTPLADVKVGELGPWLSRRNKSPSAMVGAVSRAFWRWQHKYYLPKNSKAIPFVHFCVGSMFVFYIINYDRLRFHSHQKHHW